MNSEIESYIKLKGYDHLEEKVNQLETRLRIMIRNFIKSVPKEILRDELKKMKIINKNWSSKD